MCGLGSCGFHYFEGREIRLFQKEKKWQDRGSDARLGETRKTGRRNERSGGWRGKEKKAMTMMMESVRVRPPSRVIPCASTGFSIPNAHTRAWPCVVRCCNGTLLGHCHIRASNLLTTFQTWRYRRSRTAQILHVVVQEVEIIVLTAEGQKPWRFCKLYIIM